MKRRIRLIAAITLLALLLSMGSAFAEDNTDFAIDISYSLSNKGGILAEADNVLKISTHNRGDVWLRDAEIRLKLPEEITIYQGTDNESLGFFSVGDQRTSVFHLTAEKKTKSKSYSVEITVSGTDQSGATRTLTRSFHIPVIGTEGGTDFSMSDISITAIGLPAEAVAGDNFDLIFAVRNNGTKEATDLKVTAELGEGLLNRTNNIFWESSLPAGTSKSYKVTVFSQKEAAEKNYPIKIIVETTASPEDKEKEKTPVSQYTGILLTPSEEKDGVKTPRLMIKGYSYGGDSVQAGNSFPLSITLLNTSSKELRNVQITVNAADGAFMPVGTGNTIFIDSVAPKEQTVQKISLRVKNDAEQKTTPLDVDLVYEDTKGNEFTAKSSISIPVNQDTRLVINDVVAPPELYAGMQTGVSVDFYNMGKSKLNNLRVDVTGSFDAPQSNAYFVGNMEPGKSDSYDFSFIPQASGPMDGTITFIYEDGEGQEQRVEKAFQFTVMEQVPWEDPGMQEPPAEENKTPWLQIGAIGGSLLVVVVGLVLRKRHKKKKERQLEMEE